MLRSMTGYGASVLELPKYTIRIELKSLNSKFLDLKLKLPQKFAEKEIEIQSVIENKLVRGRIDCIVQVKYIIDESIKKTINTELADTYFKEFSKIFNKWELPKDNLGSIILNIPDVLAGDLIFAGVDDEEWQNVLFVLEKSLNDLVEFRVKEGQILESNIKQQLEIIQKNCSLLNEEKDTRLNLISTKIKNKFDELTVDYNKDRFEQELIYYLEKLDITEEVVRLNAHIKYFLEVIESEQNPGKKLSFITQEIGREINTIGSKANDFDIQKRVVEMKDELEKIKQQLANIL